jgi:hypothetical protein
MGWRQRRLGWKRRRKGLLVLKKKKQKDFAGQERRAGAGRHAN